MRTKHEHLLTRYPFSLLYDFWSPLAKKAFLMKNLVRWLFSTSILRSALGLTAVFLGHYLGSEGTAIMTTGRNVGLFGILILGLIFVYRIFCIHLQKKSSFLLLFFNIFIYFIISLFCFYFRIYFVSNFGLFWGDLFSSLLVCSVVSGGVNSLPLTAPSGPSSPVHSSTSTEDSFGIRVLMEPWPITINVSLESSIQHRTLALENDNSPFLLDKEKGEYWREIKTALTNCSSQRDYNGLLYFENRDLIRIPISG